MSGEVVAPVGDRVPAPPGPPAGGHLVAGPSGRAALRDAATAALDALDRHAPAAPWSGAAGLPLDVCPEEGAPVADVLERLGAALVAHGVDPAHPRTAAHLHCPTLVPAVAADLLAGATNQSMDSFDQAPAATYAEDALVRWLAARLGLPATASGVLTAGGTASNLLGLTLARARRAPLAQALPAEARRWRVLASDGAHFSVRRAAGLLGLGGDAVVPVATDARGRMDVAALDAALATLDGVPFAIAATAGTTDAGAIDPLDALADRAAATGAHLHVDAAVGGLLALSDRLAPRLAGLGRADTVTVDLHKLGWQPIGASALLVRDGARFADLREPSDYLDRDDDVEAGVLNLAGRSLDTSRRFTALPLLATLGTLGRRGLAALVEHCVGLSAAAAAHVRAHPDLELLAEPDTVCVLFGLRGADADARAVALQRRLLAEGTAVLGRTRWRGRVALKLTTVNPAATADDLAALLDDVAAAAASEARA